MTGSPLPRGMTADLDALDRVEDQFAERYSEEASKRWRQLANGNADVLNGLALDELRRSILGSQEMPDPAWELLEWELEVRIDLLEELRAEAKQGDMR